MLSDISAVAGISLRQAGGYILLYRCQRMGKVPINVQMSGKESV